MVVECRKDRKFVFRVRYKFDIKNINSVDRVGITKVIVKDKKDIELVLNKRYPMRNVVSIDKVERLTGEC